MGNKTKTICLAILFLFAIPFSGGAKRTKYPYLDPKESVENRVNDLMSRMTLEQKIAQMCQYVGLEHMRDAEKSITEEELLTGHARGFYRNLHSSGVQRMVERGEIGSFLHVLNLEEANHLQSLAKKSPLKIPLLIGIDAIHGNGLVSGTTIYPSPITAAASFSPELWEQASRETAIEMRATGSHWAFTPNIEIARDARWGRVGETFGEDPYLVSRMGVASVRGLQTDEFTGNDKVIACVKHLLGGGAGNNGTNASPVEMGEGEIRNIFLPPFKAVIEQAKPFTLMPAHNDLNGVPCHANKWLIDQVIRKEYGFEGFVVSDWMDMEAIATRHKMAKDIKEAFLLSVDAGVDMHMHGPEFGALILELVEEGRLSEDRVNIASAKILEAKFKLGLFENRYVSEADCRKTIFTPEHQQTALEIARRGIVLLKNEGNLLPIDTKRYKNILVTGPNANNQSIMGDWVFEQPEANVHTILRGIESEAEGSKVDFVDVGWNLRDLDKAKIEEAIAKAAKADLAIVVVGEDSYRQHWREKTCGENRDRMQITLWGMQDYLVESIHETGVPTIVILVNGRPLGVEWIAENIPAVIEAWEPGSMGGKAVGEILFGRVNPSGKLPITIPRHVGQISTYYNHKPSQYLHKVIDAEHTPLYWFGYGLSYTQFKFNALKLSANKIASGDEVEVSIDVQNIGEVGGEEVVQLYIRDDHSLTTRPVKELKRFARVRLNSGERATVNFTLNKEDFSYYNNRAEYVLEPGTFTIMVGNSSLNEDLVVTKLIIE